MDKAVDLPSRFDSLRAANFMKTYLVIEWAGSPDKNESEVLQYQMFLKKTDATNLLKKIRSEITVDLNDALKNRKDLSDLKFFKKTNSLNYSFTSSEEKCIGGVFIIESSFTNWNVVKNFYY